MAALNSPVELPTARNSLVEYPMTANIQDPSSWNALNNDGNSTRPSSKLTTASEQTARASQIRSRPSSRGQQSASVKASPAAEFPPQELEAQPVSYFPPRQSSAQTIRNDKRGKQSMREISSNQGHAARESDDHTGSTSSLSTAGTHSLQESQVYMIPTNTEDREGKIALPNVQPMRSANNSVKKAVVPTSKYKKKPPPSLRSSARRRSGIESPLDSPMSSYTHVLQSPNLHEEIQMLSELPAPFAPTPTPLPTPPLETQANQGQAPLQHAKSTASVRKARALHSHPSLPSIQLDSSTSPQIPQPSPSLRSRKSMDAPRSRPSIYELQEPSPAPTTPLPDLPAGVQPLSRRGSRDRSFHPTPPADVHVRPGTSSSSIAPVLRRQDTNPQVHAEMANFMTSSSKVIFRRFHDVHVRLLLTLQDEISVLERELAEIENVDNSIDVEREGRRMKILSELRKLMAEYDHLFTNWTLMQASKANATTREELEQHLKRPGANPGAPISPGAVEDLLWLQTYQNDLSCVDLNAKKDPVDVAQRQATDEKKQEANPVSEPAVPPQAGRGGGFAALFASCAGKRK